jgi:hypothetical protein
VSPSRLLPRGAILTADGSGQAVVGPAPRGSDAILLPLLRTDRRLHVRVAHRQPRRAALSLDHCVGADAQLLTSPMTPPTPMDLDVRREHIALLPRDRDVPHGHNKFFPMDLEVPQGHVIARAAFAREIPAQTDTSRLPAAPQLPSGRAAYGDHAISAEACPRLRGAARGRASRESLACAKRSPDAFSCRSGPLQRGSASILASHLQCEQ